MTAYLFRNARIVDGTLPERGPATNVLVDGGFIREVGPHTQSDTADVIDLAGRTLMPGLIDCHVHVVAVVAGLGANAKLPNSLVTAKSILVMRDMLMRGFTTVRDVGGADFGLKGAADQNLFPAPRLLISGKALSQTGGHCDFRGRYDDTPAPKSGFTLGSLGRICDGVPDVRRAARGARRTQGWCRLYQDHGEWWLRFSDGPYSFLWLLTGRTVGRGRGSGLGWHLCLGSSLHGRCNFAMRRNRGSFTRALQPHQIGDCEAGSRKGLRCCPDAGDFR